MFRSRPLPSLLSALVLALALIPFQAFARETPPVPPAAAADEAAPARTSGKTKGTIAGAVFGAIAGTMLAASLDEGSPVTRNLMTTPLLVHDVAPPARRQGATPVLRVGVGLAVTAFGAILGRTIGATSDRRAAASRHGDAGPAIDHALRDLRAESVPAPTPGGVSCRTSTGS